MGFLDKFEQGVERAVNKTFSKVFRSEIKPVDLASALRRETPRSMSGIATFSRAESSGMSWPSWNTKPKSRRRSFERWASERAETCEAPSIT